ncbi:MAG: MAPEG family protein [Labilithrix sp.]|nr:MAPEG family protein [Labilithrix sp.]MCW5814265.1 MAPEG family protein [Labilithrix sp.]
MTIPTVTALYGSLNALLNVALGLNVVRYRTKAGVSLGEGGSKELLVAVRTHSNNAEFVPLALVMLLVVELCGGASLWLHAAGGALFLGRVLHVIGMPRKAPNPYRFIGVTITYVLITALAAYALWLRRGA